MNIERLNYAIEIMKQARNLDMTNWRSGKPVESIEELHACGNTACFAGYLALSPEWDGKVASEGQPYYPPSESRTFGVIGGMAINKFLGMTSKTHMEVIELVVTSHTNYYLYAPTTKDQLESLTERSKFEHEIATRVGKLVDDRPWDDWRPEDVIKILEALRDGHFDDIELGEDL